MQCCCSKGIDNTMNPYNLDCRGTLNSDGKDCRINNFQVRCIEYGRDNKNKKVCKKSKKEDKVCPGFAEYANNCKK